PVRCLTGEVAPASVATRGGRYVVDDDRTIPDTTEAVFEHASGMLTAFSLFEANGQPVLPDGAEVELRGTIGTAYANVRKAWIVPERGGQFQDPTPRRKSEAVVATRVQAESDLDRRHARNFLELIKGRSRTHAD